MFTITRYVFKTVPATLQPEALFRMYRKMMLPFVIQMFQDQPIKVVGIEKEGGSRSWQMIGIGLRPRRSRFVCLIILLSSLILCISVSAPIKQNE